VTLIPSDRSSYSLAHSHTSSHQSITHDQRSHQDRRQSMNAHMRGCGAWQPSVFRDSTMAVSGSMLANSRHVRGVFPWHN
jgi:hypothetical protein